MLASIVIAGAMLVVPATGLAAKDGTAKGKSNAAAKSGGKSDNRGRSNGKSRGDRKKARSCARTHRVGFSVGGTLVSVTPDDPATEASEATVTLKISSANRHARRSGDIEDQDPDKKGVQVRGATFTVPAGDAFRLRLRGYEGTETPAVGDRVKVIGRIALTKKRCAPDGTSTADRYGAIDVRRVTISKPRPKPEPAPAPAPAPAP